MELMLNNLDNAQKPVYRGALKSVRKCTKTALIKFFF